MKIKGNLPKVVPPPKLKDLNDGDVFQIRKESVTFYIRGPWSQTRSAYEATGLDDGSQFAFSADLEVVPCLKAVLAFEE